MEKYIKYINEFQEWNEYWKYFVEYNLQKEENTLTQDQIEHCLDFVWRNKKKYKTIWLKTILEKVESWNKKLIEQASSKDNEIEWEDYEVIKDFGDGFRFVRLISKACYAREWKLMSHCVSSYYWGSTKIYSLRDKKNLPHCTIEEDNQIKGKWNWNINPKYVKYVVEFLEDLGMSVWENEMKNLWYYKLDKIDKDLTCDDLYKWYVYEDNLDKIKDKDWEQYYWMWLWNIKDIFTFNLDMSFKMNFDIKRIAEYCVKTLKKWNSWMSSVIWDYWMSSVSWYSWMSSVSWYSWMSSVSWDSWKSSVSWDYWNIELNWFNNVWAVLWKKWQAKWKKGSWFCLCEYNNKWICIDMKATKIDWKKIKENIFYTLQWWEFVEAKEK